MLKQMLIATSLVIAPIAGAMSETVAKTQEYKSLDIAPDGTRLASMEPSTASAGEAEPRGPVVVRRVDDGLVVARIDPCHRCRYSGFAWSPDSTQLAFLAADEQSGSVRVELATPTAGHAPANTKTEITLATIAGVASTPRWSPDGSQLALLATIGAKKKAGALEAGAPMVGEIGTAADEQRIAVVSRAGGELRQISPADTYVYEYDWTPDGHGFVATAAKGNGDNNWWVAEIDAVDLATGRSRTIAHPGFQISMPRATPDGKGVVFIGGLMSDFGAVGGEIYEVPFEGGTPVSRTPGFRGSFASLAWRNSELFASALIVDRMALLRLDKAGSAPQVLWSSPVSVSTGDDVAGEVDPIIALSADGERGATVVEDFGRGPTIIAGPVAAMRAITHENDALQVALDVKSVTWKSDGFDVQGWLVGPANRSPGRRYPMIVQVHGGPSAAASPYFGREDELETPTHLWATRGYYVFLPNPRGSYGQGEAFTKANIRDFGGGDLRDILAGVETVLAESPVDGDRLGIYGHSYGGFMTMWAVTHTQRFKAAVAGAGIANWISYYGENGIDQWMIPFFGASVYDDPAVYRAASPIESIKQARTPTLIYVGELDVECPAPQSFEFWHGLRAMNVPTQLIVYPGAGHWFYKPPQAADLRRRQREWFNRYLAP
ncbi:MAG: prolyl oligopeptidase family serine peptidase [Steroidobacteraceae bacterium]